MPPSLFDPDLKKQWAKKHLDELAVATAFIGQHNGARITTEDDPENGWYVIRIESFHDLAVFQAALIAGDFISNLRSCLDHLAWQLACLGGVEPGKKVCFPICEVNDSEARRFLVKSTKGMPTEAVAIVQSFQPYHAGKDYRSTPLWRLNKLWNIEKHRHLTPHSILPEWQFKTNGVERIESQQIDNCMVMRVPLADKHKVEFNPECRSQWTIYERDLGLDLTIVNLTEIYEFVAHEILPAFERFFP